MFNSKSSTPSQKGFVNFFFLIALPLLVTMGFLSFSLMHWTYSKTALSHFCEEKFYELTGQRKKRIQQALALNKGLRPLLLKRQALIASIAAATASGQFKLIPPLVRQKEQVEAAIKKLMYLQDKLIMADLALAKGHFTKVLLQLNDPRAWQPKGSAHHFRSMARPGPTPQFLTERRGPDPDYSELEWRSQLSSHSRLQAFWKLNNHQVAVNGLQKIKQRRDNKCEVYLDSEQKVKISEDRSLLNSSSVPSW